MPQWMTKDSLFRKMAELRTKSGKPLHVVHLPGKPSQDELHETWAIAQDYAENCDWVESKLPPGNWTVTTVDYTKRVATLRHSDGREESVRQWPLRLVNRQGQGKRGIGHMNVGAVYTGRPHQ